MSASSSVKRVRSLDGFALNPKTSSNSRRSTQSKSHVAAKPKKIAASTADIAIPLAKVIKRSDLNHPATTGVKKSHLIKRFSDSSTRPLEQVESPSSDSAPLPLAPPAIIKPSIKTVISTASSVDRKESMLQAALAGAPSDLRKLDKRVERFSKSHKRAINAVFVSGCFVVVAGLFGYLNIAKASVRIAAARAGINATMPQFTAGYEQTGKVTYAPGQVAVDFHSSILGDNFSLNQRKTLWDSQSLLANYVLPLTSEYQTYRDRGLTIYVWGKGHAAWVDHGMLYEITQDNSLTIEQILKIATSL